MKFIVNSMSCNHCVNAITKALTKADENVKVDIDLTNKTLQVQSQLTQDAVLAVLVDAGYEDAKTLS